MFSFLVQSGFSDQELMERKTVQRNETLKEKFCFCGEAFNLFFKKFREEKMY